MDGVTHSGPGPPTPIINQNDLDMATGQSDPANPSIEVSSSQVTPGPIKSQ